LIVTVARKAGLGLPSDEHLWAEQICGELPGRAAAVQGLISIMTAALAERCGGARALAGAARGGDADLEPTGRRWVALAGKEPRPIGDLSGILACLAKYSRSEITKTRRRIRTEPGPAGDRQAIVGHLSLAHGADEPVMLMLEETLALPAALALAALLALVCLAISRIFRRLGSTAFGRISPKGTA
jgi:hypothetical protein